MMKRFIKIALLMLLQLNVSAQIDYCNCTNYSRSDAADTLVGARFVNTNTTGSAGILTISATDSTLFYTQGDGSGLIRNSNNLLRINNSTEHPDEVVFFDGSGNVVSDSGFYYSPTNGGIMQVTTDTGIGYTEIVPNYANIASVSNTTGDSLGIVIASNGLGGQPLGVTFQISDNGFINQTTMPVDTGSVGEILAVATNNGSGITTLEWSNSVGGCEISCGTYSATITNVSNIDNSSGFDCQYMRVGNTVTVSGRFNADVTLAATASAVRIDLPIASNFLAITQAGGTGATVGATTSEFAQLYAGIATDDILIQWISVDTGNQTWSFSFTYQIL
jgi:hypothetical protein